MWLYSSHCVKYRLSLKEIEEEIKKIREEIDKFQQLTDDEEAGIPVEVCEQLKSFTPVS